MAAPVLLIPLPGPLLHIEVPAHTPGWGVVAELGVPAHILRVEML